MKTLARIGAGLSFASFFLAGAFILARTAFRVSSEYLLGTALGLFFLGTAFFVGPMLWLAGEKLPATHQDHASNALVGRWLRKILLTGICAFVGAMVVLFIIRVLCSVFLVHPSAAPATP